MNLGAMNKANQLLHELLDTALEEGQITNEAYEGALALLALLD